jgi:spore coat polysaccharide biosynthesis protein SpsF (cytidylyltransferase family)
VDYPEDFEFIKTIFEKTRLDISLPEVLDFLAKNPEVVNKMNADLRNTALKGED